MVGNVSVRIGCGLSSNPDPRFAAVEASEAALRELDGRPADLVLTFASGMHLAVPETMLEGVNDSDAHARELAGIAKRVRCKFNLIPFNPFASSGFRRSDAERIRRFAGILQASGLTVTTRKTRSDDIAAACGQLAGDVADRTRRSTRRIALKEVRA